MDPIKLTHAKTRRAYDRIPLLERRNPYDFEIKNERIFAIGRKVAGKVGRIR